jgi:phospholipid/cholesterol/gamma-HCH transport system substrate-binding protein
MRFHFSKFERVAGLFVLTAFFSFSIFLIAVAVKQGWFDSKIFFTTVFESAEGVHPGSIVQISGLKAGANR